MNGMEHFPRHTRDPYGRLVSTGDRFLYFVIIYSMISLYSRFDEYKECKTPVHYFLFFDQLFILVYRTSFILTGYFTNLLYLRYLQGFRTFLLYPFFICFTITGTVWYAQGNNCLTSNQRFYFIVWLTLSYIWILLIACLNTIYVFTYLINSENPRFQFNLQIAGVPIENLAPVRLTKDEIETLPMIQNSLLKKPISECTICLDDDIQDHDIVLVLPACAHAYHKECVVQWLQANNNCCNCSCAVKKVETANKQAIIQALCKDEDDIQTSNTTTTTTTTTSTHTNQVNITVTNDI